MALAYGAGLRASEVVNLKVADVDSQRTTLRVEQGKGAKDSYAMRSPVLLQRLPSGRARSSLGGCSGQVSHNLKQKQTSNTPIRFASRAAGQWENPASDQNGQVIASKTPMKDKPWGA